VVIATTIATIDTDFMFVAPQSTLNPSGTRSGTRENRGFQEMPCFIGGPGSGHMKLFF
jgi:hypothetical protein